MADAAFPSGPGAASAVDSRLHRKLAHAQPPIRTSLNTGSITGYCGARPSLVIVTRAIATTMSGWRMANHRRRRCRVRSTPHLEVNSVGFKLATFLRIRQDANKLRSLPHVSKKRNGTIPHGSIDNPYGVENAARRPLPVDSRLAGLGG